MTTELGTELGTVLGTILSSMETDGPPVFDASKVYALSSFSNANYVSTAAAGGEAGVAGGFFELLIIRPDSAAFSAIQMMAQRMNNANQGRQFYITTAGAITASLADGGGVFRAAPTRTLSASDAGRLHVVILQHDGAAVRLYVNRTQAGSGTAVTGYTASANAHVLGAGYSAPSTGVGILASLTGQGTPTPTQLDAVAMLCRTLGDVPSKAAAEALLPAPSVPDATILALTHSWYRADSTTDSGGKTTAFVDKVNASYTLAQATSANQVTTPTADAAFNNQLAASFVSASTHYYTSNRPAADWAFLHQGPCEIVLVYTSTATTGGQLLGTRPAAAAAETGISLFRSANTVQTSIGNGTATQPLSNQTVYSHATQPGYEWFRHDASQTPNVYVEFLDGANGISFGAAYAAATGGATPTNTLVLGARAGGTFPQDFKFLDLMIFNRLLTPAQRQTVRDYIAGRYRFYGYTSGVTHRWSLRDTLLAANVPVADGAAAPASIPDSVTLAATDAMAKVGSPTVRVLDPAAYPRTSYAVIGSSLTSYLEGAANAGFAGSAAGFWVALFPRFDAVPSGTNARMLRKQDFSNGWKLLGSTGSALYFSLLSGGVETLVGASGTVVASDVGAVQPVVGVYTGTAGRLYFRGAQIGSDTTCAFAPSAAALQFGRDSSSGADGCTLYGFAAGLGVPTASQIAALSDAFRQTGRVQTIPGMTAAQLVDLTLDVNQNGGPQNGVPATVLDRIGTDHLTRVGGLVVVTNGSATGLRNFTAANFAAGVGFAGVSTGFWASVLCTVNSLTGVRVLFGKSNHSNAGWYLYLGNSYLVAYIADGSGVLQQGPQVQLTAGQLGTLLHVAMVLDSGTLYLYLNGASVGTPTAITGYTPGTTAMTLGATNGGALYPATNVDIFGAEGGHFVPTAGEIATASASSLSSGSIAAVAGKTPYRYDLKADTSGGVPTRLVERTSGAGDLSVVNGKLQVATRTERLWSYETSPLLQGAETLTLTDYFEALVNALPGDPAGFTVSLLCVVTSQSVTGGRHFSQRGAGNPGWEFLSQGSNASVAFSLGGASSSVLVASTIAATDVGKIGLYTGVWDAAAGSGRLYAKRAQSGTGSTLTGGFAPDASVKAMIGRRSPGNPALGVAIYGAYYALGVPSLAQVQAQFDLVQSTERIQPVPGLGTGVLIDLLQDTSGGSVPATLIDRGSGGINFTRIGAPTLARQYARGWTW